MFAWALLIGLSSVLIVNVGVTELLILILLYCGVLHMTWSLGEERSMDADRAEG